MADDFRGVYLIGNKSEKVVTAVLVQNRANGVTSTLPLDEYVHRGLEPADGTLPWEEDIKDFGAAITGQRDTPTALRMATSETAPYPTAEPRPANLDVTQALPPQPPPVPVEVNTIGPGIGHYAVTGMPLDLVHRAPKGADAIPQADGNLADNADVFRVRGT